MYPRSLGMTTYVDIHAHRGWVILAISIQIELLSVIPRSK
jgi:hypothetical protein